MHRNIHNLILIAIVISLTAFKKINEQNLVPQYFVYDEDFFTNPIAQPWGAVNGYPQNTSEGLNQRNYRPSYAFCNGSTYLCQIYADPTSIVVLGTTYTVPDIPFGSGVYWGISDAINYQNSGFYVQLKD